MAGWNYRIIKRKSIRPNGEEIEFYALHEVYYDKEGKPNSRTVEPITFVCDDDEKPDGIIKSLEMALDCAKRHPVLTDEEIEANCNKG